MTMMMMIWLGLGFRGNEPVAGLAGGAEELVGVEEHDLVLVGFVDEDAVYGGGVRRDHGEPVAHHPEHALHSH